MNAEQAQNQTPEILTKITSARANKIAKQGHALGVQLPETRRHPVVEFTTKPFVICEVKRRSPSRGSIASIPDPVAQAGLYTSKGITSVSVLTEEDHFSGSLLDLISIKDVYPGLAVLRKDFLLDVEDVITSWIAGADAILLIAAILTPEDLGAMYKKARELGMAALVEVHNERELDVVRSSGVQPELMGINSRNLNSFVVDLLAPLSLRKKINWSCEVVYESGIFAPEQVALAVENGFTGVLVGEAAVKFPELPGKLSRALTNPAEYPASGTHFWGRVQNLLEKRAASRGDGDVDGHGQLAVQRPLVKICGITNRADAQAAVDCGADMLGFIFAESPRKTNVALLRELSDLPVIKVAVVTTEPTAELVAAYKAGYIDVFQYHGPSDVEPASVCTQRGLPFFKALSIKDKDQIGAIMDYPVPRVLIDAWSAQAMGGTGKRLDAELVRLSALQKPLWLAGGLNPENVREIIRTWHPELIDASSGLESVPGEKDHKLLKNYFEEINNAGI